MIGQIKYSYERRRAKKIASLISPHINKNNKILDFGCGRLFVGDVIAKNLDVDLVGIDVIDINSTTLPFRLYDGKRVPFKDKTFDVTYACFVFHHTDDTNLFLSECIRVTREKLIILEDVYNNKLELCLLKLFDYVGNKLSSSIMNIPFNFKKEKGWVELFKESGIINIRVEKINPHVIPFRPTRHRLFLLQLAN